MSIAADLAAVLGADATLSAVLTGGVHAAMEISRQTTPSAFDANGELLPCALVKLTSDAPGAIGAQAMCTIWCYERNDTLTIEDARMRMRALLHRQVVPLTGYRSVEAGWRDAILNQYDVALHAYMNVSRYIVRYL